MTVPTPAGHSLDRGGRSRNRREEQPSPAKPAILLREHQGETVRAISDAFESGARTVFLHAPVGSGKSLIHLLTAGERCPAYVTTPQTLLVDQYGKDTGPGGKFEGMAATLYGRRNYPCPYARGLKGGDPKATAEGAPCTLLDGWPWGRHASNAGETVAENHKCSEKCIEGCPKVGECPYYLAKAAAKAHSTAVVTLAYFLVGVAPTFDWEYGWPPRPLLVIDEAHGLPEDLVTFFAVDVTKKKVGKRTFQSLPGFNFDAIAESDDPLQFMRDNLPPYLSRMEQGLKALRVVEGEPTPADLRRLEEQKRVVDRTRRYIENLSRDDVVWVHDCDRDREPTIHRWRPLNVAPFAERLWSRQDRVLLSSATFFGVETLEQSLGLPSPCQVVTVADTFPAGSAPIHVLASAKLNKKTMSTELPRVMREITRIARNHKDERGIVHCNSYLVRDFIVSNADAELSHRLSSHTREDRNESLKSWTKSGRRDSIFVAVAMSEGLDLAGDLSRWQVIVKAPFPNLGDPWVMRRRDEPRGRSWYVEQTIIDILQACGRVMRSKDDRGVSYILDSNAQRIIQQRWAELPGWFRARVEAARAIDRTAA